MLQDIIKFEYTKYNVPVALCPTQKSPIFLSKFVNLKFSAL